VADVCRALEVSAPTYHRWQQLYGGLELADDLLRRVPGAFHGRVPGPDWPDEDSHSPWTGFRGPRHSLRTPGVHAGSGEDVASL